MPATVAPSLDQEVLRFVSLASHSLSMARVDREAFQRGCSIRTSGSVTAIAAQPL